MNLCDAAHMGCDVSLPASVRFDVRSIPTTILFQGGREVGRVSGALSAAHLNQWLDGQLKS